MEIFSVSGSHIRTLLNGRRLDAGRHAVEWDASDDSGDPVPSGMYFYRITAAGRSATGKVLLVRD
jgi:flagellar hook assembly protein FlgD